ncbi:MAG: galactose mutarotase [Treponema sp.]|nr:galactose mutarotase [Treponema sp.]
MQVSRKTFGILSNGKKVHLYTLKAGDLKMSISTLGATWTSLVVPSKNGQKDDILLGFSTLAGYTGLNPYMGATIGRVGNRIGYSQFPLGGQTFHLYNNDGQHSLHGGRRGFDKKIWKAEVFEERDGIFVRFELDSPDGDEGYPGNLRAIVNYGLSKSNEVTAIYEARIDAPSPVNMTNHSYFNLAGEGNGNILSHELLLHSSSVVEVNNNLIPTGKLLPVSGGPFDFRSRKSVQQDFSSVEGGYDHCFAVDGEIGKLRPCAEVFEADSGRSMKVYTTQPGVQFYTGNFLSGLQGKLGSVYNKHSGFCLETQHFPDSPNKIEFPSCIFGAGRDYYEKTVFSFNW